MKLKVCIAGATGWVGKPLCLALSEADDLTLVGAVSRTHKGQRLNDVLGTSNLDLVISGSVAEALETPTDVLVDYTNADVVKANVMTAIRKGVHVGIKAKSESKASRIISRLRKGKAHPRSQHRRQGRSAAATRLLRQSYEK
jgi:4-hydroxy-tetrahydrodipicolinate reductase